MEAELKEDSGSGRVLVECSELDKFLRTEGDRTALLALPPIDMKENLAIPRDGDPHFEYSLELNGVENLVQYLGRCEDTVAARALYLVPETITWTRHWENLPEVRLEFGQILAASARWTEAKDVEDLN